MTGSGPIERKVSWSSLAATVLTGLVFAANHTDAIPGYDAWPAWAKGVVSVLVIAGGTFGAGYAAPHTPRQPGNVRKVGGYPGGHVTGGHRWTPPADRND